MEQPPPYSTARVQIVRVPGGADDDAVALEEPLEIRIGGRPVAVTMRTPGHDEELALGFCISEGLAPVAARLPVDLAANAVEVDAPAFEAAALAALPARLRDAQAAFDATGGLHATGLFDVGGALLCVREDVGRHNA